MSYTTLFGSNPEGNTDPRELPDGSLDPVVAHEVDRGIREWIVGYASEVEAEVERQSKLNIGDDTWYYSDLECQSFYAWAEDHVQDNPKGPGYGRIWPKSEECPHYARCSKPWCGEPEG